MLQSHLLKESAAVHYISRMSDYKEKLRDAIADGAWQLLQHFVCRDYKTSQRGNGAGGVHSRHNAHRLYSIPSHQPIKSEAKPKKCEDKVTVRMVSPAQATVEQARSEAKQLRNLHKNGIISLPRNVEAYRHQQDPEKKVDIVVPFLRMAQGAINSELMLFQNPVVNEGIEYLQWIECRPVNQITEDGSIGIHLKASRSQYLDLQRSRLYVKAKIVKEDGGSLEATDVVTPVNLWLQSLWNQVDVFLQQKLVSSSGTNYAYKALMDVLLNYGGDAESTQLQTQLFYRDTGGSMENTKLTDVPLNQGLIKRNLLAKNSATIDMVGQSMQMSSRCQDTY